MARQKVTTDDIKDIIIKYLYKGKTTLELANEYGLDHSFIVRLLNVERRQAEVSKIIRDLGFDYYEFINNRDLIALKNRVKGAELSRSLKEQKDVLK